MRSMGGKYIITNGTALGGSTVFCVALTSGEASPSRARVVSGVSISLFLSLPSCLLALALLRQSRLRASLVFLSV